MCDRKDSEILKEFSHIKFIYTNELIDNIKEKINGSFSIKDVSVAMFLLEKVICDNSAIFYANEGSTVSNYINYVRYINNLDYYNLYINTKDKIIKNKQVTWRLNKTSKLVSWSTFWSENIIKNPNVYKIITLTNNGYRQLTENLLVSMKKCGMMNNLKIYCIDTECYNYFKKKYPHNETELVGLLNETDAKQYAEWVEYKPTQSNDIEGRKRWSNITLYKIIVINNELRKNNDVIFIDGDIVIFKNFVKDLYNNINNNDLIIQNDNQNISSAAMCTGFFLMKSNARTIECTDIRKIDTNSFNNDQLYLRSCSDKITHTFLDLNKYPNGKYYRINLPERPNIIHFNYDIGTQKINRMKNFGYWYIEDTTYCMTFSRWINLDFSSKEIIINSSVKDGSDSFTELPIAVQHDYLKYTTNNNNEFLKHTYRNTKLCLSSFRTSTDKNRRGNQSINRHRISNILSTKTFISRFNSDSISYFKEIGKYKFVICPEGNGVDTHRLWETLYSKGIPIVEYNELMHKKCHGLPILWSKDFSELTEEYLNKKYEEFLTYEFDFSTLYLSFYGYEEKKELLDRSKFWCIKRQLGNLFYRYYDINVDKKSNTYNLDDSLMLMHMMI